MAIYIPSAIIGELRGSIGSTCFARNSFATYARNKAIPTNPNTILQRSRRTNFAMLTSQWSTVLSAVNRISWNAYAAYISWQNPLGQTIRITGFNHFLRLNTLKIQAGLTVQVAAPTVPVLPPPSAAPPLSVAIAAGTLSLTFLNTEAWCTEVGAKLMIFGSPPYSASRTFLPKQFRYVGSIAGAVTPPTSPQAFTPPLPFTYTAGAKALVYCRIVRLALGVSTPEYVECVAT